MWRKGGLESKERDINFWQFNGGEVRGRNGTFLMKREISLTGGFGVRKRKPHKSETEQFRPRFSLFTAEGDMEGVFSL